ncbi:MAG: glycerate kinase [Sulfobacillus thermosulfidooxidans]|uniref:Glycerate kinase n=1 Tax=Sulfobacillus thermosulfidooxidans TaxID=28034 RepID=A0A2T2X5N8_SULTH|nr:MAG: glycerate kinase [Sulfobacillus thermosulfidooxidans]
MKILVAVDSFKGSLSSLDAGRAIASGLLEVFPSWDIRVLPVADGGEGTAAVAQFLGGKIIPAECQDIYGRLHAGYWVLWNDTAIIEVAVASGFVNPDKRLRDGDATTSYGTGQLIRHALSHPDVSRVIVALGGSGSTDGGMGLMAALDCDFFDQDHNPVKPLGSYLGRVMEARIQPITKPLIGLTDVNVLLTGTDGAVMMFGPQKGVPSQRLNSLDQDMAHFAQIVQGPNHHWDDFPGAGSAGGMGFAILALGGILQSGAEVVANWVSLDEWINWADWIITGEGKLDSQTLQGKLVNIVTERSHLQNKPVVAIVGSRAGRVEDLYKKGVRLIYPIVPGPLSLEEAMTNARCYMRDAAIHVGFTLEQCHP